MSYTQTFDNGRPSQSQSGDPASDLASDLKSQNQQMLALMAKTPQQPQNQFAKPIGSLYVPGYASPGANDMYGRPAFGALPPPPSSGTRSRTDSSFIDRLLSSGQQPQQQQPQQQQPQQQQPQQQQSSGWFSGGKSYRMKARKAAKKSRKARKAAKKSRRSSRR